ncbi:MAG: XRE family transcriptional regulator [Pseudohongiella nitratireducens]|nr:XRE family transcriptional regulator [Pseudohongiella nitratireducens]MDF1623435.1 XRE family transcriptional regulator [Pseudohongiella nitratireducens]
MESEAFVQLALKTIAKSQKELAALLAVSPTQISKWKRGEHMSTDMEEKFRSLTDIGDHDPRVVLWTGSVEAAIKWERLIDRLAELAMESDETGYITDPLTNPLGLLYWHTFYTLSQLGVHIPPAFPKELEALVVDTELDDDIFSIIENNQHASLIDQIFRSLTYVYGFYAAYIDDLIYDDALDLIDTPAINLEHNLMELAASKVEPAARLAPNFLQFKHQVISEYRDWLTLVKDAAFRAGVPLRAELLNLLHDTPEELGQTAEAEWLGFNSTRLHPDIYMNELLVGMRVIHQVLPAILKKLDLEDEFTLDETELHL